MKFSVNKLKKPCIAQKYDLLIQKEVLFLVFFYDNINYHIVYIMIVQVSRRANVSKFNESTKL